MDQNQIQRADPATLAGLMDVAAEQGDPWRPEELGAILQHQLDSSVEFELGMFEPALGPAVVGLLQAAAAPPIRTFRELFCHHQPPKELLNHTRQFAKSCRQAGSYNLPPEIATIMYVTSITVARLRLGERLTSLDDAGLSHSLRWALAQPWLDGEVRRLLAEGLGIVGSAGDG